MTTQSERCRRCGAAVVGGERFCGECGLPLSSGPAPSPPSSPASPPRPAAAPAQAPAATSRGSVLGALLVALIIAGSYFAWTRWLGPARGRTEGVSTAADSAAPPTVAPAAASAPLAGAQQPLVSDEAVSWAETNSFDRYQARQKLEEGRRYLQGDGVPVDYERARLLLVAAAASEGRAAFHLFEIYGNGLGVVPDINASFQWLGRAAELGDAQGQYVLARFYIDGFSNILAPDQALADRWMRASAAQGYQPARDYLTERDRIP